MIKHTKNYQAIVQQLEVWPKCVPKLARQVHQNHRYADTLHGTIVERIFFTAAR